MNIHILYKGETASHSKDCFDVWQHSNSSLIFNIYHIYSLSRSPTYVQKTKKCREIWQDLTINLVDTDTTSLHLNLSFPTFKSISQYTSSWRHKFDCKPQFINTAWLENNFVLELQSHLYSKFGRLTWTTEHKRLKFTFRSFNVSAQHEHELITADIEKKQTNKWTLNWLWSWSWTLCLYYHTL